MQVLAFIQYGNTPGERSRSTFSQPQSPLTNTLFAQAWNDSPFAGSTFSIIVCVGEVLAYCDPAKAIREFARVIANSGRLICDFRSSRSLRYLRSKTFGRAADLIHDEYNGTPEPTWVYDPQYIRAILHLAGFRIRSEFGIHTWSNLARRLGSSTELALTFQRYLASMPFPVKWADLITIVADRI